MKGRVVWVTGAHGFIGRNLTATLVGQLATVAGIGHGAWPASEAGKWGVTTWLNGDITTGNLTALKNEVGRPTAVFHLAGGSSVGAAISQPREDFARTVSTTVELLDWVRQESPDTSIVAISSAAVYGAGHVGPIAESATLNPYSPYGYHKLMMESLCRSYGSTYGVRSIVARLFSVYGCGLKKQLLWDICGKLALNPEYLELGGTGDELRDWVDVRDVVRILSDLAPAATAAVPTVNVGVGVGVSVRDVTRLVTTAWCDEKSAVPTLVFNGKARLGDPFSLVANPDNLYRVGARCLIPLAKGISEYVAWFKIDNSGVR